MSIYIDGKKIEYTQGMLLSDGLHELNIKSDPYLFISEGNVLDPDDEVNDGDDIIVMRVVSGG